MQKKIQHNTIHKEEANEVKHKTFIINKLM